MNRHKHWPLLTSLSLGILLCVPLTSCDHLPSRASAAAIVAVPVRTAQAISADVPLEIAAVGNAEAINSVDIKSRVAGEINSVAFAEGQSVTKGQLLFSMDREALERQILEQTANLERDAAMEQQAQAVVARDLALEKQSQSEADVARQLGQLGVLAQQRVDQLVTTTDTAQAALHADQAAAAAAAGSTRADHARLAQTQLQLQFTNVVAPISGRAGAIMVKAGNMVRDNDATLVTLRQLAPIYVTFGIPEQSLQQVRRLNAVAQLLVSAAPDTPVNAGSATNGHLVFIDNAITQNTGTIRLKAAFANADNALWPGEFVRIRLRLGIDAGKTVVPESAIQAGLDGKFIWLVKSGIATTAPVTVLRTYRSPNGLEEAVIGTGIKPGDTVVTEGQLRLTANARVTVLGTERNNS